MEYFALIRWLENNFAEIVFNCCVFLRRLANEIENSLILFAVKAFLAQAKEEFNKKWEETPQVGDASCYSCRFQCLSKPAMFN